MKLWQLVSIMRDKRDDLRLMKAIANTQEEWKFLVPWLDRFNNLVSEQTRAKLDDQLPIAYVRCVLAQSDLKYYLSADGWLRGRATKSDGEIVLSTIEAFERYGGEAIEDTLEYGSVKVFQ